MSASGKALAERRALVLDGARVEPARLEASGFRCVYPDLERALRSDLGR